MSRAAWNLMKNSKGFYVRTYRKTGVALVCSAALNLLFILAIYHFYFNLPERDFFATNGITAPTELTPLDEPNYTSVPLLSSSSKASADNKVIPQ